MPGFPLARGLLWCERGLTFGNEQFDQRGGIGQAVGMVLAAFLGKDFDAAAGTFPEIDNGLDEFATS